MRPENEETLAEMVREAASARTPLEIAGGGSKRALGRPVDAAVQLSSLELKGVSVYEPGALTLVARAGEPLSAIDALLSQENQRLAFEPMDVRKLLNSESAEQTIGGVVATATSGPRRVQAGGTRDTLLGARFVNGKGEIVKTGGRVMKNVTGYDLARLMCGAFGTLGVLTEVSFKVLPKPETSACVLVHGLTDADAVRAMSAALGSPYDVSGAAHLPAAQTLDGVSAATMLRLEGFADSVAYRAQKLRAQLAGFGETEIVLDHDRVAEGWAYVRDCQPFCARDGAVWRISVKPSDAAGLTEEISAGRDAAWFYDLGGGLIWLLTPEDDDAGAAALRAALAVRGGRATLFRASAALRETVPPFHPEADPAAALIERIRASFDPVGILNPGKMTPLTP